MKEIILVGTVHIDQDIVPRTKNLLDRCKPAAVTVEQTLDKLRMQDAYRDILDLAIQKDNNKHIGAGGMKFLRHQIDKVTNREIDIAKEYAESSGVYFELIDHPGVIKLEPPQSTHIDVKSLGLNTRGITIDIFRENARALYKMAYQAIINPIQMQRYTDEDRYRFLRVDGELRDAFPADRLLRIMEQVGSRVVHLCGGSHLHDDARGETLYSLLKDKAIVRRTLLDQFD